MDIGSQGINKVAYVADYVSLIRPTRAKAKANKRQWDALLFGYFVLGKQNKVTRLKAKKEVAHIAHYKQVLLHRLK